MIRVQISSRDLRPFLRFTKHVRTPEVARLAIPALEHLNLVALKKCYRRNGEAE